MPINFNVIILARMLFFPNLSGVLGNNLSNKKSPVVEVIGQVKTKCKNFNVVSFCIYGYRLTLSAHVNPFTGSKCPLFAMLIERLHINMKLWSKLSKAKIIFDQQVNRERRRKNETNT